MPKKLLPITIITVQLDMEDRLRALEKKAGIKLPPFKVRTVKYRQPTAWVCSAGVFAHRNGVPCPKCRIKK